jgi:signal transduction histidine kinase
VHVVNILSFGRIRLPSSLRWRFSLAIMGLVLLSTMCCVVTAVVFLSKTLVDRSRTDLQQTVQGVSSYVRGQKEDLLGSGHLLATSPSLVVPLQHRNRQSLIFNLIPIYADLNADIIDVVDRHGIVIVRMEDTLVHGDSLLSHDSIRRALQGTGISTVALETDLPLKEEASGYALRATVPVRQGGRTLGVVIVGRRLDSLFAQRIGSALSTPVNVIAGGHSTGTTLVDVHGLPVLGLTEPSSVLARIANNRVSVAQVTEDRRAVLSGLVPLTGANGKPVGAIEVVKSLDPLYALIRQLSVLLIALGAAIVVLGALLALSIATRLTRRLLALEAVASRVADAAEADEPLRPLLPVMTTPGRDEVASLARSTAAMMTTLDKRLDSNKHLYEAAQARVCELSGLAEIARLLTAVTALPDTLDRLSEQVCHLVGCSSTAIMMLAETSTPITVGGYGLPDAFSQATRTAMARGPQDYELTPQEAIRTGKVVRRNLDGIRDGPGSRAPELDALMRSVGWRTAVSTPLCVQGRTVGALTCYATDSEPFSDADVSLLTTVADQVAVAIENARLYLQAGDVAALGERARLARELHDSVTQALFSMTMHARAAQLGLEREGSNADSPAARNLRQLGDLTRDALAEMRALIFELRPRALQEEGLVVALQKHAAAVSAREGVIIAVEVPDAILQLEPAVEEDLYRLGQEALHNVVKHSGASRAVVRLEVHTETVTMVIMDEGRGFDPTTVPNGHFGLSTMADRAMQMGATIDIDTRRGGGTIIRVTVPRTMTQPVKGAGHG